MWVMAAAVADARNILVDEVQSTVTPKCFLIHHIPVTRLGVPATKVVAIKPVIPNLGISTVLRGSPMLTASRVNFMENSVFP